MTFNSKIKNILKNYKEVILYVLKVFLLYLVTKLFFFTMGIEGLAIEKRVFPQVSIVWEAMNDFLRIVMLKGTYMVLLILGHKSEIINNYSIRTSGMGEVIIGNYCIGIQLWFYFAALIIPYEGSWRKKVPFILFGIICINIINIFRFTRLMYISHYNPALLNYAHEYVFNKIIYAFAVFMLYLWITRYSSTKKL